MNASTDRLLTGAVVVVSLCAIILTGFSARRAWMHWNPDPPPPQYLVSDWKEYGRQGHRIGDKDAPVTIVMFSDYQCPACKVFTQQLMQIQSRHKPSVTVVVRHFPLPGRPYAEAAAHSAICAAEQDRFVAMHNTLFSVSDSFAVVSPREMATRASVPDLEEFEQCLAHANTRSAVAADLEAGRRLGVVATPTLLVNDEQYVGGAAMRIIIERSLNSVINDKIKDTTENESATHR